MLAEHRAKDADITIVSHSVAADRAPRSGLLRVDPQSSASFTVPFKRHPPSEDRFAYSSSIADSLEHWPWALHEPEFKLSEKALYRVSFMIPRRDENKSGTSWCLVVNTVSAS